MNNQSLHHQLVNDPQFKAAFDGLEIYGVAGTNGSGKDTIMELMLEHGYYVFNTSNSLRDISKAVFNSTARGGNDTPMGRVGNAERATYAGGMLEVGLVDWWVKVAHLPKDLQPKGLVIGSLRAVGEVKRLKEFGGKLIVIDADQAVRYERLRHRGRIYEENISFEQFQAEEAGEMAVGETDPTKFGMAAVIDQVDITLTNASDDIEVFKNAALQTLGL